METLNECGLKDLGFSGEKYTWEKSRGQENWIQESLDRGVANDGWSNLFPAAEVQVIEVATSDHLPLFLQLNKQVYVPKGKRFKFENIWIREHECRNIVKNGWEVSVGRDIVEKIRICGVRLQEWGGGINTKYKLQLQECRRLLRKLRSRRDMGGIHQYNEVRSEYLKLLERQEVYWKQRAKQHWLREGDKNTRIFHRFASVRRKNNRIERIKDADGNWQETSEAIQRVIEGYFMDLFASSNADGRLSEREIVKQLT
ncbi:uncharacterized protein LOC141660660 [Apium graveolens]|uniref:uncharacterized protein LOC141660660 n=1 Tax=Apium graveolens TaxID=4045 RepID=UPI003D7A1885